MAKFAIAGFFILIVACGVGFGVASADSSDDLARAGAFGFDEETHEATKLAASSDAPAQEESTPVVYDRQALAELSTRDISNGMVMIDEWEIAEQQRREADDKAVVERVQNEKAMQGVEYHPVMQAQEEGEPAEEQEEAPVEMEYNLPAVDWTVGKEAFMAEWTGRIDAYLAGTALAGYGKVFAEAAWENGVDPRWSPAISNTESTNGAVCFLPHNAWGWGSSSWPDWETAIHDHVAGLAAGYGYSITVEAAQRYCPPNYVHWYTNTITQMGLI